MTIDSPFGRQLKFLLDTGATHSFLDPKFTTSTNRIRLKTDFKIKTVLSEHTLKEKAEFIGFKEFKTNIKFTFLLFKFHDYFDGLLGIDLLSQLKANIDLKNLVLRTEFAQKPIILKQNRTTQVYLLEPQAKTVVALPVNIKEGEFNCKEVEICKYVLVTEGLYKAKDNVSYMEVVNYSDKEQKIYLDSPLTVEEWKNKEFVEVNVTTLITDEQTNHKIDFNQLRIEHLNKEEEVELKKLLCQFPKIFHKETDRLSFSNQIKHFIPTTDEIPIYSRPFKYAQCEKILIN